MKHPLTDEMCDALRKTWGGIGFSHDDMRAAYDKGFSDAIECVRREGLAHYSALYEAQESFYKQQENN